MAKLYTEEQQEHVAVDKFKEILGNSNMWFNSRTFPTSESDDDAFIKCSDSESAEEFCPKRWEAMQKWMENTKDVRNEKPINSSLARKYLIFLTRYRPVHPLEQIYPLLVHEASFFAMRFFDLPLFPTVSRVKS